MTELYGGKVASVEPDSIAEEAGILPGDAIISLNSHKLTDIIDYKFYSAEEEVDILVRRGDEEAVISIEKDIDDPLGIDFEDELFDGVRECGNRCIFCFVHQLPKGMRRPLYLKDDDFRLSFLHGNFVTLVNVSKSDIARIIEQRLSPLYISVHTTEPDLRRMMIGKENVPDIMDQLRTLSEGGITLHTQIVICPGVNDGKHLDRTVSDLASLHPHVASIGIVPVGLTKHRRTGPMLDSVDQKDAREIIKRIRRWQKEFRVSLGTRLVWASDEFYLPADVPIPSASSYEGYPQYENGIGIVRRFKEDAKKIIKTLPTSIPHPVKATIVTSTLAAPIVQDFINILNKVDGIQANIVPIRNEFFGESVTVTGLITGQDIINQLKECNSEDLIIIPSIMLRDGKFLDDLTLEDIKNALGCRVISIEPTPRALVDILEDRSHLSE